MESETLQLYFDDVLVIFVFKPRRSCENDIQGANYSYLA
jgi:hypothetical protein